MKKIIFLFISMALIATSCKTQKDSAAREVEILQNEQTYKDAVEAINNQNFVLEADRVNLKNGQLIRVNPITNFVALSDGKATVQLAFTFANGGPNGLGGITLEGNASNVKISTDRKGNTNLSMTVIGTMISGQVLITLIKNSNFCNATVISNFRGNRITFSGYLYSTEESNIFKGRAL